MKTRFCLIERKKTCFSSQCQNVYRLVALLFLTISVFVGTELMARAAFLREGTALNLKYCIIQHIAVRRRLSQNTLKIPFCNEN